MLHGKRTTAADFSPHARLAAITTSIAISAVELIFARGREIYSCLFCRLLHRRPFHGLRIAEKEADVHMPPTNTIQLRM